MEWYQVTCDLAVLQLLTLLILPCYPLSQASLWIALELGLWSQHTQSVTKHWPCPAVFQLEESLDGGGTSRGHK